MEIALSLQQVVGREVRICVAYILQHQYLCTKVIILDLKHVGK